MGVKFQQGEKTHKTLININIGGQERRFAQRLANKIREKMGVYIHTDATG